MSEHVLYETVAPPATSAWSLPGSATMRPLSEPRPRRAFPSMLATPGSSSRHSSAPSRPLSAASNALFPAAGVCCGSWKFSVLRAQEEPSPHERQKASPVVIRSVRMTEPLRASGHHGSSANTTERSFPGLQELHALHPAGLSVQLHRSLLTAVWEASVVHLRGRQAVGSAVWAPPCRSPIPARQGFHAPRRELGDVEGRDAGSMPVSEPLAQQDRSIEVCR